MSDFFSFSLVYERWAIYGPTSPKCCIVKNDINSLLKKGSLHLVRACGRWLMEVVPTHIHTTRLESSTKLNLGFMSSKLVTLQWGTPTPKQFKEGPSLKWHHWLESTACHPQVPCCNFLQNFFICLPMWPTSFTIRPHIKRMSLLNLDENVWEA